MNHIKIALLTFLTSTSVAHADCRIYLDLPGYGSLNPETQKNEAAYDSTVRSVLSTDPKIAFANKTGEEIDSSNYDYRITFGVDSSDDDFFDNQIYFNVYDSQGNKMKSLYSSITIGPFYQSRIRSKIKALIKQVQICE